MVRIRNATILAFLAIAGLVDAKAVFKNYSPNNGDDVTLPSNNKVTFGVTAYDSSKGVSVRKVWVQIAVNGVKVATPVMSQQGSTNNYEYTYSGLEGGDRCCYRIKQRNSKNKNKWSGTKCFDVFAADTSAPSDVPSMSPTVSIAPSSSPTPVPSAQPSLSQVPSAAPSTSAAPSSAPTGAPSGSPTATPSQSPTVSASPSSEPTPHPTPSPTRAPTYPSSVLKAGLQPDCNVKVKGKFSICLDLKFSGLSASTYAPYFLNARDLWQSVINTNGIYFTKTGKLDKRYTANGKYPSVIDGVYIASSIQAIDGSGSILGYAGPVYTVSNGGKKKAITGQMVFDKADLSWMIAQGTFQGVVQHEMGHVLGIGTLWSKNSLVNYPKTNRYFGSNVKSYWTSQGCKLVGGGAPIIEMDGGSGTAGGHFDEACFDTELMTGYVDSGMVMSRLTLGTLKDLGFGVDMSKAESFTFSSSCCSRRLGEEVDRAPRRRRLSAEKEKAAVEYGKGTLKRLQKLGYLTGDDGMEITDGITVYVEEDGHIVDVEVSLSGNSTSNVFDDLFD